MSAAAMKRAALIVSIAGLLGSTGAAAAGSFPIPGAGGIQIDVPRKSMVDLKFTSVVRQRLDLSCGAAALATLLTYFYGDRVGEIEIIAEIAKFGDREKIEKEGFSMLELKKFGERRGYISQGYRVNDVAKLAELKLPVITLVNINGYNHFVVIKGARDGQVFTADPAFGNRSFAMAEFARQWNSVILAFASRTHAPKNQFALAPGLKANTREITYLLDRSLTRIRPNPGEF